MSQEIGNAWLPQMGTDPFRLRAIREISRLRNAWLQGGRISAEDQGLHEYQSRLLIPVTHTAIVGTGAGIDAPYALHLLRIRSGCSCGAAAGASNFAS